MCFTGRKVAPYDSIQIFTRYMHTQSIAAILCARSSCLFPMASKTGEGVVLGQPAPYSIEAEDVAIASVIDASTPARYAGQLGIARAAKVAFRP